MAHGHDVDECVKNAIIDKISTPIIEEALLESPSEKLLELGPGESYLTTALRSRWKVILEEVATAVGDYIVAGREVENVKRNNRAMREPPNWVNAVTTFLVATLALFLAEIIGIVL